MNPEFVSDEDVPADVIAREVVAAARAGDHVLVMSNGGFGGARQTLTAVLQRTRSS